MTHQIDSPNLSSVTTGNFNPYDKNRHRPAQYSNKKKEYNLKISEILKDSRLSPSLCTAIRKWADRRDACGINLWMSAHQLAELGVCTVGTIYRQLAKAVSLGILVLIRKGSRGRRLESEYVLGSVIPFWEDFLDIKGRKGARLHYSSFLSEKKERVPPTPLDDPDEPVYTTPTLQPTPPAEPRVDENVKIENKEEKKKEPKKPQEAPPDRGKPYPLPPSIPGPTPKPVKPTKPQKPPKEEKPGKEKQTQKRQLEEKYLNGDVKIVIDLLVQAKVSLPGARKATLAAVAQGRIREALELLPLAIPWVPTQTWIRSQQGYLCKLVELPQNARRFKNSLKPRSGSPPQTSEGKTAHSAWKKPNENLQKILSVDRISTWEEHMGSSNPEDWDILENTG